MPVNITYLYSVTKWQSLKANFKSKFICVYIYIYKIILKPAFLRKCVTLLNDFSPRLYAWLTAKVHLEKQSTSHKIHHTECLELVRDP